MGIEQGLISKPASRYTNTTYNKGFIKSQLQQQMKQSLLAEAAQYKPDTSAIAETLANMKFHAGDKTTIAQEINNDVNAFNKSYGENPFNAFSKENKTRLEKISNTLNNPENAQLARRKEADDAMLKLASENETLNKIQIRGKQIKVIDLANPDGKADWVSLDVYNKHQDRLIPLTVQRDYDLIAERGAKNGGEFTMAMANYSDILKKANDIFDKVGSSKTGQLNENGQALLKLTSESNQAQLNKAYAYLVDSGLTTEDINTLISEEFRNNPGKSYEETRLNALASLQNLANSKISTTYDESSSKNPNATGIGGTGTGGDKGLPGAVQTSTMNRVFYGQENNATWSYSGGTESIDDPTVTKYITRGTSLDYPLSTGIGSRTFKNTNGDIVVNKSVMANDAFRYVVTTGENNNTIRFLDEQGNLQSAPKTMFRNAVILSDGEDSPIVVNHLVNVRTGKLATTEQMKAMTNFLEKQEDDSNLAPPKELQDFIKSGATNNKGEAGSTFNLMPTLAFTAVVKTTDNDELGETVEKTLRENGVQITGEHAYRGNVNNDITDKMYDYMVENSPINPREDINDNLSLPRIMIPIPDYEQFALMFGAETYEAKDNFRSGAGSSYGKNDTFIKEGAMSNNDTISNQTKDKNLGYFDELK